MSVYWMSELIKIMKGYKMSSFSEMNCSGQQEEKNWGKEGKIQSAKSTLSNIDHSKASALPPKTGCPEEELHTVRLQGGQCYQQGSSAALVHLCKTYRTVASQDSNLPEEALITTMPKKKTKVKGCLSGRRQGD